MEQILRLPQVTDAVGLSRATIYRLISEQRFPQPVRLSSQAVGWLASEVEDWITSREPVGEPDVNPRRQS